MIRQPGGGPGRTATAERLGTAQDYRLLVESVTDYAILLLDPQGHIATWNEGARRLKGYDAAEVIGKHFSIFYRKEDVERGKPELELRVSAEQGRFEDEGWRVRKDGSRFWANVIVTALREKDGTLRGFGKMTRDLSERKQAEEALAQRTAQLEAALSDLHAQQETIRALSTPVLQVREHVLLLPIVGMIDALRARQLTEHLLGAIRAHRARVVVVDVTGVPLIDTTVANHLIQAVEASRLMGARCILTGLSAEIARTLATLGVDLGTMDTLGDLQEGIAEAERRLGYEVTRRT